MESQSTRRHSVTRRRVLAAGAALPLFGITSRRGSAAEPQYKFKYANNMPVTHPINVRAHEILPKILQESNGELEVNVFPNNQLGGDSDMLSQLRSGALEMFTLSGTNVLSTLAKQTALIRGRFRVSGLRTRLVSARRGARRFPTRRHRQAWPARVRQTVGHRFSPDHQQHETDPNSRRPEGIQDSCAN
jgi:Bacterial extracellular solute-binding protein, family 7